MLNPSVNRGVSDIHSAFHQHILQFTITDAIFAVPAYSPQNNVTPEMSALEFVNDELNWLKNTADFISITIFATVPLFGRAGKGSTLNGTVSHVKAILSDK